MANDAVPEADALRAQGGEVVEKARGMQIVTEQDYASAAELLKAINALKKSIAEAFREPKANAFKAHRSVCDLESTMLGNVNTADGVLRTKIIKYQAAEREARQRAEAAAQAELKRQEEERRLSAAVQLEQAGHQAEAEAILDAPATPAPVVQLPAPKVSGLSTRTRFKYRITDAAAVKREFLIIDDAAVRALVARLGPDAAKIVGGISVFEESSICVRAAGGDR